MGVLARIKAAFTPATYLQASIYQGMSRGSIMRPHNALMAIRHFDHWAYAATMLNANAVANVPLRLYARKQPGKKKLYETRTLSKVQKHRLSKGFEYSPSRSVLLKLAAFSGDVEEVVEPHPALQVLQNVNPWQNGYELTVLRMIDLQATGNSYMGRVMSELYVPSALWRMPPQWVEIVPSRTKFIDRYIYGKGSADQKDFDPADIIQFRLPNPNDLFYGKGWYEAAWKALGLHESKREMDLSTFDNMARPDWLISVPKGQANVIDRLEAKVNEKLRGTHNSGNFLAMEGDIKAQALQLEVKEIGTATRVIEEISAVSGVPVAMLLSNDPTRASSSTARVGWYRNTIHPYCRLDEEKLNERWLPMFEGSEDMFLCYDLASFEDEEMQSKRLIGLVAGGVLTPNEARAELAYDKHEDGDDLYPPSGLTAGGAAVGGDLGVGQNQRGQQTS